MFFVSISYPTDMLGHGINLNPHLPTTAPITLPALAHTHMSSQSDNSTPLFSCLSNLQFSGYCINFIILDFPSSFNALWLCKGLLIITSTWTAVINSSLTGYYGKPKLKIWLDVAICLFFHRFVQDTDMMWQASNLGMKRATPLWSWILQCFSGYQGQYAGHQGQFESFIVHSCYF